MPTRRHGPRPSRSRTGVSAAVPVVLTLLCGAMARSAPAQLPPPSSQPPRPAQRQPPKSGQGTPERAWVALKDHDPATSRRAFAACDEDGDDRLDVRECLRTLTNMGTAADPRGFRDLDANRDGFVYWDEFDARFRRIVASGHPFRFRPERPFAMPKPDAGGDRSTRAAELLMSLANQDDDPELDAKEFAGLLRTAQLPAAAASAFQSLDTDRSGGLSAAELVPAIRLVPMLLSLGDDLPVAGPQPLSEVEVAGRLRRLHPTLGRFAKEIFRGADRDGDGALSPEEVRGGTKKLP